MKIGHITKRTEKFQNLTHCVTTENSARRCVTSTSLAVLRKSADANVPLARRALNIYVRPRVIVSKLIGILVVFDS